VFTSDDPARLSEPLALLTRMSDRFAAQVLAARLDSEGIACRLRGESFGPYPVTVGNMALTEIWVPERDLDEARAILAESEADAEEIEVEPAGFGVSPNPLASLLWWLVAALLLAWLLWLRVGRFL
jgi:hypothetical protein